MFLVRFCFFFFFNDTATTEIYTLSLHDALPIFGRAGLSGGGPGRGGQASSVWSDRKSTRLNSCHDQISYAVFCLKKKKKTKHIYIFKKNKSKDKVHIRVLECY